MDRYRGTNPYDGRRGGGRDESLRITVDNNDYYRRGRSPSPRDRFRGEGDQRRHDGSPRRDDYRARNNDFGGTRWPGSQERRNDYGRRSRERSPDRPPKRYSPSWRRRSSELSPRRSPRNETFGSLLARGREQYNRSKSRSTSRGRRRSKSRSRSRGRGRYKNSPSPRRSPRGRSPSYGERKRYRRSSSSSSRSGSRGRQRSGSAKGNKVKDDIFKSMYSHEDDNDSENAGYLHPALNRGMQDVLASEQSRPQLAPGPQEQVAAERVHDAASLTALSQAYGASPPRKTNPVAEIDDVDRFLYGDDGDHATENRPKSAEIHPPSQRVVPENPQTVKTAPEPVQQPAGVTPGGFDSNALKNVLKAIGFDFEMSAQQSATAQQAKPAQPEAVAQPPPAPQPQMQLQQPVEVPQPIQAMHSGSRPHVQPQAVPVVATQPQTQEFYQPYDPYGQKPPQTFVTQHAGTNLAAGYPVTVQDQSNPAYMVYQPVSSAAQQPVQAVYPAGAVGGFALSQGQDLASMQRVVLPPQMESLQAATPEPEKLGRQERLNYLQEELEKLKRQQNELMRKKRKEKDGHKDPLIKKNNILQAGVEEQIREIREAAERAAGILSDSSEEETPQVKAEKEEKYDFFDPGNHWCKLCNTVSRDLGEFLSHLHSKTHRKAIDPYDRPWNENEPEKKKKSANCISKGLKGSEFLIPITGYFCTLCQTFSGDQICAEDHCKSYMHNMIYKKHCKKNPSYERKFKKKKKAAIAEVGNGERVAAEVEPQYVEKRHKKSKHAVKEEKYVEKEPKDVVLEKAVELEKDRRYTDMEPNYVEKKQFLEQPIKPNKYEEVYVEKRPKHVEEQPRYVERETSRDQHKHVVREPERTQHPRESRERDADGAKRPRHYDKREYHEDEKRMPRKFSGGYERRPPVEQSSHKKSRWSPGYDEYERSQQEGHQRSPERRKEKKTEDPRERWVERNIKEEHHRRPDESAKGNQQSIGGGVKIPTPGFGKFSWNSNTSSRVQSSSFDQIPVDNIVPAHVRDEKRDDLAGKGKIAMKIIGKSQLHPPRLPPSQPNPPRPPISPSEKMLQEKRAAAAMELQKKVAALKKENALRAQLSSITLPAGRNAKQLQSGPNMAAVIVGSRGIGRGYPKQKGPPSGRPPPAPRPVEPRPSTLGTTVPLSKRVGQSKPNEPHLPSVGLQSMVPNPLKEPPPPGEEDIAADGGDDANSDASGISMEIASDED